ncbi:MAG TPA: RNA methyltransferase [Lacipirellulaceae bacterium]|nr:RNA methyltransferase [Lacipirellulaceae bacterium]
MTAPSRITSRQNPHVKEAVCLRDGHERRRQRRFIVEGVREISRAIESGVVPICAFVCEEFCTSAECIQVNEALTVTSAEIFQVTPEVYAKLAFGDRHEGIIVVAATARRGLSDLRLPDKPLIAVLEGVEKPGNVGAILRSADAAGVDAVIIADGGTDLYNPNTIRASLGTVFRQNVCEASSADTLAWVREHGISIVATRPDAKLLYTAADLRGGVAIILGSEATGLSEGWTGAGTTAVRLPMHGLADSLNVATTAAVLFYEAVRQRSQI